MKVEFTVTLDHPVDVVWPYLAEPEKWLEWIPALVERTRIDDGPIGPGTKWRSVDRVGPLVIEFTDELIELTPKQYVAFKQSSPWNSRGEYRVESDGDKTVVHTLFEGRMSGKLRWMNLTPGSLTVAVMRKDLKRLEALLDSGSLT